ncbi:hypothetical protein [Rhizobium herbae]
MLTVNASGVRSFHVKQGAIKGLLDSRPPAAREGALIDAKEWSGLDYGKVTICGWISAMSRPQQVVSTKSEEGQNCDDDDDQSDDINDVVHDGFLST